MFWPPDRIGRAGGATTIFTDAVLADPGRVLRGGGVGLDVLAVCWTVSPTAVASAACMLTRSGCLRVLALGRHSQCPVRDGWCGLDRDEQQIESADRRCHGPEPTGHPTFGTSPRPPPRPLASRIWSTVPSAHVQRDTPDLGAPNSEFLTQRDKLDRGICRARLPRSVQSASGETVTWLQAQAYRAARARRAERIDVIWEGCVN